MQTPSYHQNDKKYFHEYGKTKKSRYDEAATLMMTVDCTTSDSKRTQSAQHHKHRSSATRQSDGYIPPYLRKLNRRYKQLYNLMEGVVPSDDDKLRPNGVGSARRQPIADTKWMEANLFEEQREQNDQPAPSIDEAPAPQPAKEIASPIGSRSGANSDEINEIPEDDRYADRTSDGLYKVSPKSKSFMYHRVMSANSGSGVGGGSISSGGGGGTSGRKQRLPFVAITNKRLQTSGATSSMNHKNNRPDVQQNMFPMP